MKRKIYLNIAILAALVTFLVAGFLLATFYNFHIDNEIKALKDYGHIISEIIDPLGNIRAENLEKNIDPDIRITMIDLDGNVLFDNIAKTQKMENHLDRPEVKDALEDGEGEAVRNSTTLGRETYYYASLLSNNSIFRISRQSESIYSHFSNMLPFIFLIIFLIILLSFFTSSLLTKKILEPVENAVKNIEGLTGKEELEDLPVYDELLPFMKKVKRQEIEIKDKMEILEERAALMDVISSSMEEGLILLDKDKKILSTNLSAVRFLQGDEDLSYRDDDFIKLSRNIRLNESLTRSIDKKSSEEVLLEEKDKFLNIYINPVMTKNKLVGLVILLVDFTEKHRMDKMRKDFSANVSHELKTPLTSISGYAELIENGMARDEDIKKFAATIRSEGSRLLNLIDSIIKLSKIEEGVDDNFTRIDLYEIGKNTIEKLKLLAARKNIALKLEGETSFINGNEGMIEELIYNLLDNAIRYTDSDASVDLNIGNEDGWAYIKVKDRGIGIPESEQNRIFERFYTVDKSRSKNPESTGLGLSIVKHIVERHQGKIELVSEVGKGTEIIIKIKLI